VRNFDDGTYWESVETALGQQGAHRQREWGNLFLETLRRHRLASIPHSTGHKFVTPILLHGGIPYSDLPNFFEHVLYPFATDRPETELSDAEQLIAEWRETSSYQRAHQTVRRTICTALTIFPSSTPTWV